MNSTQESTANSMLNDTSDVLTCYFTETTLEPIFAYKMIVIGYLVPFVALFGIPFNIVCTYIYGRPTMKKCQTNEYLRALAVSDIGIICCSLLLFSADTFRYKYALMAQLYARTLYIAFPMGLFCQTMSMYLTVLAGADCYVALRRMVDRDDESRLKSRQKCRPKMPPPRVCIGILFINSLMYNVIHAFEAVTIECYEPAWSEWSLQILPTDLRMNEMYDFLYYTIGYTVIMGVAPLFIIICLVILILRTLAKHCSFEYPLHFNYIHLTHDTQYTKSHLDGREDALSLITVVGMFILCNSLALSVTFMELVLGRYHIVNRYAIDLSNLLVTINSSANLLIYCACNKAFRQEVDHLFWNRQRRRSTRSLSAITYSGLPVNGETDIDGISCERLKTDTQHKTSTEHAHLVTTLKSTSKHCRTNDFHSSSTSFVVNV